ncbi:MAG: hypothetical protein RIB47_15785 [Cyclobacteriaceae bacterium]
MFLHFGQPKNISDLNQVQFKVNQIDRKDVPIVLIDNERFEYMETLRLHGFNITQLNDLEEIQNVLAYEIVLCDIKGIGKKFKSRFEGAHIMKEIHRRYPFKIIYAYTGYTYDPSFNEYLKIADSVLKKDIEHDEWIEALDDAIGLSKDPSRRWRKIRNYLLEREVTMFNLTKLENEYVTTLLDGGDISKFPSERATKGLPPEFKTILSEFTTSIVFKLATGI